MSDTTNDVAGSLSQIVEWFDAQLDQPDLQLGAAATEEQLSAVEGQLGLSLPASVRSAYGVANGQSPQATHPFFPDAFWWLPLDRVSSAWDTMNGLFEGDDDEEFGKEWWHPGLIPLAEDGSGDGFYIDLDGRNAGVVGEVLQFVHDDWPFQRTARTDPASWATDEGGFDSMLHQYAQDLAAGRFSFDGSFLTSGT